MKTIVLVLCLLSVFVLAVHSAPSLQEEEPGTSSTVIYISPEETDSSITQWNSDHVVVVPEPESADNFLLLYLTGKNSYAANQTELYKTASDMGSHVIGLSYANDVDINNVCQEKFNCTIEAIEDMISNINETESVLSSEEVTLQDTIEYRLVRLLMNLNDNSNTSMYHWENFFSVSEQDPLEYELKWDRILIAGEEQGGLYALQIAKENLIRKVSLFSSPIVSNDNDKNVVKYLRDSAETESEMIYAFSTLKSSECKKMLESWKNQLELEQFGSPFKVESDSNDFAFSHQIVSNSDDCGDLTSIVRNYEGYNHVWNYVLDPRICDEPCDLVGTNTSVCIFNGTCLDYEPISESVKCESCSNAGMVILIVFLCLAGVAIIAGSVGIGIWYYRYKTGPRSEHYEKMPES
eukprot:gb/GECH01012138.1/.p1 GENE.gb/GECH01012138.1/~~gb/GECH01012138.1/.p1  ORF type:complete len:408 (+),score=79.03 gb/GECH01012138.1/:1-1224(+)